jgi:hypothetical protein
MSETRSGATVQVGTRSRSIRVSTSDGYVRCTASDGRCTPARPASHVLYGVNGIPQSWIVRLVLPDWQAVPRAVSQFQDRIQHRFCGSKLEGRCLQRLEASEMPLGAASGFPPTHICADWKLSPPETSPTFLPILARISARRPRATIPGRGRFALSKRTILSSSRGGAGTA